MIVGDLRHSAVRVGSAVLVIVGALVGSFALYGCSSPTPAEHPATSGAAGGGATGSQEATPALTVIAPQPPPLAARPTETATSTPATQIAGTVQDADGKPLVDVSVVIVSGSSPVPAMAIFTDAFGHYIWPVAPGTYTLEASRDGYVSQRQEATVDAGMTATADFELGTP
jgi:hypothetical protein